MKDFKYNFNSSQLKQYALICEKKVFAPVIDYDNDKFFITGVIDLNRYGESIGYTAFVDKYFHSAFDEYGVIVFLPKNVYSIFFEN